MDYTLETDPDIEAVLGDIDDNHPILRDAWVVHDGERWHPVIVRMRNSDAMGFDVNSSGTWGSSETVGRKKFIASDLLINIAQQSFPPSATIRCKTLQGSQRNGRRMSALQFSARLGQVIVRMRKKNLKP